MLVLCFTFFSANTSTISFDVYLTIPKINFVGKYYLRIKILLLEIAGKGNMTGTFGELVEIFLYSLKVVGWNSSRVFREMSKEDFFKQPVTST